MDKKNITREISDLMVLQTLTDAYAKVSSGRMKKTRDSVLLSREFLIEIQAIFHELQESYRDEVLALARKKGFRKGDKITLLSHNGRSVAVFLSTNTGFYGELTKKVFNEFAQDIKEKNLEATIVGKLGLSMFREVFPNRSYSYFELPDYGVDRDKMSQLVRHLVEYEEIHIYYGKFKNIVNQEVDKVVISAQTQISQEKSAKRTKYLFEPDLEEILMFFETEMFSSVFDQTVSESQLAKFASRMLAMDNAGEKVKQSLSFMKLESSRVTHYINNKKQQESLPGIIAARRMIHV